MPESSLSLNQNICMVQNFIIFYLEAQLEKGRAAPPPPKKKLSAARADSRRAAFTVCG